MPSDPTKNAAGFGLAGLGALLALALMMQTAQMVLAADIPSATDGCIGGMAEITPSTEFVAIEEGRAVQHTRTTLEWQRCALGQTWNDKNSICDGRPSVHPWEKVERLAKGWTDGWRLPSGNELMSIVETCRVGPAINPQVFPNTPGSLFWSSSIDLGGIGRAWSVSFFSGKHFRPGKIQNGRVRLVRGTMKVEPDPNLNPNQVAPPIPAPPAP